MCTSALKAPWRASIADSAKLGRKDGMLRYFLQQNDRHPDEAQMNHKVNGVLLRLVMGQNQHCYHFNQNYCYYFYHCFTRINPAVDYRHRWQSGDGEGGGWIWGTAYPSQPSQCSMSHLSHVPSQPLLLNYAPYWDRPQEVSKTHGGVYGTKEERRTQVLRSSDSGDGEAGAM